jgi:hypothetical protein
MEYICPCIAKLALNKDMRFGDAHTSLIGERAHTYWFCKEGVDGRDKPGHDDERAPLTPFTPPPSAAAPPG